MITCRQDGLGCVVIGVKAVLIMLAFEVVDLPESGSGGCDLFNEIEFLELALFRF